MKATLLIALITLSVFSLFGQDTKSKVDKEFKKITSKIYPVIKVTTETSQTLDPEQIGMDQPVFKKIAGDLLCFYGIDKGSHFELLLKRQIPENTAIEQIDTYAHDNLLNFISDKTKIHKTDFGGFGFSCGGEHEAALLTLPEIWDMITGKLGTSLIFAVPSKDLIVFVNANNQTDIEGLKAMVNDIHNDGERLLSKLLFTYKDGTIEVLK